MLTFIKTVCYKYFVFSVDKVSKIDVMQIVEDFFRSGILSKRIGYQILFPRHAQYSSVEQNLPVLYLLHGLFGEARNWTELTDISSLIENLSFAIVAFDAGNSWYSDGIEGNGAKYESFFKSEFIPRIENDFKIGCRKKSRSIAGLSMGGYGALKIALKYPSLFAWSGSMSGAFDAPRQTDQRPGPDWDILGDSIKSVFGKAQNSNVRVENDLFQLISELTENEIKNLPDIYFDCGSDDSFIRINRELFEIFKEKNVKCVFHEKPGGHDWNYWNWRLKEILLLVEKKFNKNINSKKIFGRD